MKKIIFGFVALILILGNVSLFASSYSFYTKSLVAIEGSYNSFNLSNDAVPAYSEDFKNVGIGLKLGAQTQNYRVYLSARNNFISDFDYSYSLGAEVQYLFNFSSVANFFLGASAGNVDISFTDQASLTRNISTSYIGGDAGLNLKLDESVDFELGTRAIKLSNSEHLQGGITYDITNSLTYYMSLVFKYDMD